MEARNYVGTQWPSSWEMFWMLILGARIVPR
jgi:hypothetical protein